MKLVITFESEGDYECPSHLFYKCVEYESVEAFYVRFLDKIEEYKKYKVEYEEKLAKLEKNTDYEEINVLPRNIAAYKASKFREEFENFCKEYLSPRQKYENFEFAGISLDSYDLENFETVETLEDWWQKMALES